MSSAHDPVERLKSLVVIEREDIKTIIYYALGIGLMALATPVAVQALVNTIAFGALFQPLVILTLILLVLVGFSNVLAGLQFYVVEMLQRRLFVRLFDAAAQRLQNVDMSERDKEYLPELTNRFLDVVTLQKTATVMLLETLGYVLQTLIGMILLAFYHPILLAFDLFLIGMLAFILFVLGKNGVATSIEQSKAKYVALAWLQNLASHSILVKSSDNQAFLKKRTEQVAQSYLKTAESHFEILARQNIGALVLHTLANTLLLGLGGYMVIDRQLSLGQLIAAELVVSAMIYGLTRLGKTLDNFYDMLASVDKLSYLIDLAQENSQVESVEPAERPVTRILPYRVDIIDVSLPLLSHLDPLNSLSLNIRSGETLAICAGMEKGSLFELIFGLRTPQKGYILLDGQDLRDTNLRKLRDTVALVRNSEIIPGSIYENVAMGRVLSPIEIKNALAMVNLSDIVAAMPDGLHSKLLVNGKPLSDEECLRLTLARVIVSRPRLLMLDGVLNHFDKELALTIFNNLNSDDKPWTLLISCYQDVIASRCDRRIGFHNGNLIELSPNDD